jgi:hypothetical protein
MSFQHGSTLESQPTTTRRSDDAQYRDDPEYASFTESLSSTLFSLTSQINALSKQLPLLGTKRETPRVRERISTIIDDTSAGFKDVGEGLKKLTSWPDLGPQQKFTQGKLNQEFRASLTQFQILQRQALEKQRASSAALQDESNGHGAGKGSADPSAPANQFPQQQQLQEQARLAPQSEVDFQESMIVEREAEIRQIEQSVGELNELFRDVATMVHAQGEQLDVISENVEGVREDTRGADVELRSASRYQRSARQRACCLLLILGVVLLVVILAVVVG